MTAPRAAIAFTALVVSFGPRPEGPRGPGSSDVPLLQALADTMHAAGTFDVQLTPVANDEAEGSTLGRMTMSKRYRGDLEATANGEMLTATTAVESSAGYVAIERVTGTLHGRSGSFVLQHTGTMSGSDQRLGITVVPDSGTGQLHGIAGSMSITIEDGAHFYELAYTLP